MRLIRICPIVDHFSGDVSCCLLSRTFSLYLQIVHKNGGKNGREPVTVPGLNPYSQLGALSSLQSFHFIKRKANTFSDFLKSKRSIK